MTRERLPAPQAARRLLAAVLLPVSLASAGAGAARAAGPQSPQPAPSELRAQASAHLRFLYAMYFAIRACTEASEEQSEPGFRPTVGLPEAQRVLRAADASARAVGVDVDTAWLEMSSIGQSVGEALKRNTADNLQKCRQSGTMFRSITARLQMTIRQLDGKLTIIQKDF